eukprot:357496-Chlamydomonas_euryale.AAC.3
MQDLVAQDWKALRLEGPAYHRNRAGTVTGFGSRNSNTGGRRASRRASVAGTVTRGRLRLDKPEQQGQQQNSNNGFVPEVQCSAPRPSTTGKTVRFWLRAPFLGSLCAPLFWDRSARPFRGIALRAPFWVALQGLGLELTQDTGKAQVERLGGWEVELQVHHHEPRRIAQPPLPCPHMRAPARPTPWRPAWPGKA